MTEKTDEALEREAMILADQADRFVAQFDIDLSDAETFPQYAGAFQTAAHAYERIALAEKMAGRTAWFQAENVDGRTAGEIMRRLWEVREELRRRSEQQ